MRFARRAGVMKGSLYHFFDSKRRARSAALQTLWNIRKAGLSGTLFSGKSTASPDLKFPKLATRFTAKKVHAMEGCLAAILYPGLRIRPSRANDQ